MVSIFASMKSFTVIKIITFYLIELLDGISRDVKSIEEILINRKKISVENVIRHLYAWTKGWLTKCLSNTNSVQKLLYKLVPYKVFICTKD